MKNFRKTGDTYLPGGGDAVIKWWHWNCSALKILKLCWKVKDSMEASSRATIEVVCWQNINWFYVHEENQSIDIMYERYGSIHLLT